MKQNGASCGGQRHGGQRGQVLVVTALWLVGLLSATALVTDVGILYHSYRQLVAATNAAALAGGAAIPNGNAVAQATLYSGTGATDYNYYPNLSLTFQNSTPKLVCLNTLANGGLPCSVYGSQPSANAIIVTEQATVPLVFARIFGLFSMNIAATATASAKGGGAGPYNVVMVLDTTRSMGSGSDNGCTVPGVSGSPTPEQCAQYGIQQLLGRLSPCSYTVGCGTVSNGMAQYPVDEVALMVFPGLCSVSGGSCPNATSLTSPPGQGPTASDDYSCPTSNPAITSYNNDPQYLIVPFSSDYRTSDSATTLNTASDVVKAVGAGVGYPGATNCTGVTTPGGEGTFYAGAIDQAQAYLVANARPNVQNIIILLSDGDATSSSSQLAGSVTNYSPTAECQQAVTSATNAKNAGTLIYSVSYGSETSGCTTGDTLTPCQTMQQIGSSPSSTYFFSVPQGSGGGTVCAGARSVTTLNQVFTYIAGDLTHARLIPNGTT